MIERQSRREVAAAPSRRRGISQIAAGSVAMFAGCSLPSAMALSRDTGLGRFSNLERGTQWSASSSYAGWRLQTVRGLEPTRFTVAQDPEGAYDALRRPVLRVEVLATAAALIHALPESLSRVGRLDWSWRADGFPAGELGVRGRDDFAARIYLMFDYPLERVPWAQRWLIRTARGLHDPSLPAATLVYLLHDRNVRIDPVDSPYSSRVKMIAARSEAKPGRWYAESRNIRADFQAAFGAEHGPGVPPLSAIAVGADGDQTGANFTSWFGDLVLAAD